MYSILLDIFWIVVLFDLFALAVMVIFFINARINVQRQINNQQYFINVVKAVKTAKSSADATDMLNIGIKEFEAYCKMKGIDTPEERIEKKEKLEKTKREEEQKILREEANWRAEQEKTLEEERKEQEEDVKKRRDRLKKFGFK